MEGATTKENFWKQLENHIELVFQQGALHHGNYEENEPKNFQHLNARHASLPEGEDEDPYMMSQGPSRQMIEFPKSIQEESKFSAQINEAQFILDETSKVFLSTSRSSVPEIKVKLDMAKINSQLIEEKQQKSIVVLELMICEKSSCTEHEKFKVIKGGISGCSRKKITDKGSIDFKGLKFNFSSNPDKNSRLLLALYKIYKDRPRSYQQILISKDIFLIDDGKSIVIDSYESIQQYFQNFGAEFMERPPSPVKINKLDKHSYHEEISIFEKYLIKKNKKVSNIIYLAFKFPHFIELYFRNDQKNQVSAQNPNFIDNPYKILGDTLNQTKNEIKKAELYSRQSPLVCNHYNPNSRLLLRINVNMRRVRFLIKKNLTQFICIVAAEKETNYPEYLKLPSNKELKEFYLDYVGVPIKNKSNTYHYTPPTAVQNHLQSQIPEQKIENKQSNAPAVQAPHPAPQHTNHEGSDKKTVNRRKNDDDYHQQQEEELLDNQSDESENYSASDKKGKRQNRRQNKKGSAVIGGKEIKYSTRNKTRIAEQNQQQSDSKRQTLAKKIKEKENLSQQQKKPSQNSSLGGGLPMGIAGMAASMGNSGQNPMFGSFGMGGMPSMSGFMPSQAANSKQPNQQFRQTSSGPENKQSMPGFPPQQAFGMNPAAMMGMPPGMMMQMPPGFGSQKKEDSKDNKEDSQNASSMQRQGPNPGLKMPFGMMPGGMMHPGMMGSGMVGFGGMPQGIGSSIPPGMIPVAVQGPNNTMSFGFIPAGGQNQGQNPSGQSGQTSGPSSLSQQPGLMFGMSPFQVPGAMGQNIQGTSKDNSTSGSSSQQNFSFSMGGPFQMPQGMNPSVMSMYEAQAKNLKRDQNSQNSAAQGQRKSDSDGNTDNQNQQKKTGFPPSSSTMGQMPFMGMGMNPYSMGGFPGMMGMSGMGIPGMGMSMMPQLGQSVPSMERKDKSGSEKTDKPNQSGQSLQGSVPGFSGYSGMGSMGFSPYASMGGQMTPDSMQQMFSQQSSQGMNPSMFGMMGGSGSSQSGPSSLGQSAGQSSSGGQSGMSSFSPVGGMSGMGMMGMPPGLMGMMPGSNGVPSSEAIQQLMRNNPQYAEMIRKSNGMGMGMFAPPKKDDQENKKK